MTEDDHVPLTVSHAKGYVLRMKWAQSVVVWGMAVLCGFGGAVGGVLVFQDELRGEQGAIGDPGPLGPTGPMGPPGVGLEQLEGMYVVSDDFCPAGSGWWSRQEVVTGVQATGYIDVGGVPELSVDTMTLCQIVLE